MRGLFVRRLSLGGELGLEAGPGLGEGLAKKGDLYFLPLGRWDGVQGIVEAKQLIKLLRPRGKKGSLLFITRTLAPRPNPLAVGAVTVSPGSRRQRASFTVGARTASRVLRLTLEVWTKSAPSRKAQPTASGVPRAPPAPTGIGAEYAKSFTARSRRRRTEGEEGSPGLPHRESPQGHRAPRRRAETGPPPLLRRSGSPRRPDPRGLSLAAGKGTPGRGEGREARRKRRFPDTASPVPRRWAPRKRNRTRAGVTWRYPATSRHEMSLSSARRIRSSSSFSCLGGGERGVLQTEAERSLPPKAPASFVDLFL